MTTMSSKTNRVFGILVEILSRFCWVWILLVLPSFSIVPFDGDFLENNDDHSFKQHEPILAMIPTNGHATSYSPQSVNLDGIINDSILHNEIRWITLEHRRLEQKWRNLTDHQRNRQTRNLQKCVSSAAQLKAAVAKANPSGSAQATRINVCTARIPTGSLARRRLASSTTSGINMSNRKIDLRCTLPKNATRKAKQRCILDGEGIARIFYGVGTSLSISGFDFWNASATGGMGGALNFYESSNIRIRRSSFQFNQAMNGGAVMISNSTFHLEQMITFNKNQGDYAGALYSINSTIKTKDSGSIQFTYNRAKNDAGAMYVVGGAAYMTGVDISSNQAGYQGGAGIFISTEIALDSLTSNDNSAGSLGGALLFQSSNVSARGLIAQGNRVYADSGAVAFHGSIALLDNVSVVANSAYSRTGGLGFIESNVTVRNSTLASNRASFAGGATNMYRSKVQFSNCLFADNTGGNLGNDIFIADNENPNNGGSFVSCNKTVFCNGVKQKSIFQIMGEQPNTNCQSKGLVRKCS